MASSTRPWVTEPTDLLDPSIRGFDASSQNRYEAEAPTTVFAKFKETVAAHGDKTALRQKQKVVAESKDDTAEVQWTERTWTWQEYYNDCLSFGKSLTTLGFAASRSVNIIGFNSPEWFIANCGAIAAGGIAAGIYTTNLPEACAYVANHSEAEVILCEGRKQLEKFIGHEELPHLKALIIYGEDKPEDLSEQATVPVYTFEEFMALGAEVPDATINERIEAQQPGNCCTLIYTSGTTGPPKAVMISHDNITWTGQRTLEFIGGAGPEDRIVSYLPLSHIAAQMLDIHAPIASGGVVNFAQPDALRGSLGMTLKDVRPTLFFGVPRVWEKIYEKMMEIGKQTTGLKKKIATWAKAKGLENAMSQQYGATAGAPSCFGCAHKIVLSKVQDALGLDQCRVAFTGAAPISADILRYFASLNIHIFELFGQSECTGPHTVNGPTAWKIGTCGRPIKGTQSKIEESGEICYRGRHIFMGYMKMPEKTAETIDPEGWLHSGDVAKFDDCDDSEIPSPSGFMSITGRIKELIITAGGENVPPVLIEENFKTELPALSNCMAIGDQKKYLTILLCLKTTVDDEGRPTNQLTGDALDAAAAIGSTATTVEEAAADPLFKEYFDGGMKRANALTTSRAQIVQKWALLPVDFNEKDGHLTPTLKLKRPVVASDYAQVIEQLYA